jgi:hypothetical protein
MRQIARPTWIRIVDRNRNTLGGDTGRLSTSP